MMKRFSAPATYIMISEVADITYHESMQTQVFPESRGGA